MTDHSAAHALDVRGWAHTESFEEFGLMCCGRPHLNLLSDPDTFSLTLRVGRMGPIKLSELVVGADMSFDCGDQCGNYRVLILESGHTHSEFHRISVPAGPGAAAVFGPTGVAPLDGRPGPNCSAS